MNRKTAGHATRDRSDADPALAASQDQGSLDFLRGGGEVGALIRAIDWTATSLGAPETWPQSLRTAVRLMLGTNHPIFIFWGPEHICLYNQAYSASLGPEQHPEMLGKPGAERWAEIWSIIGPQIDLVMSGGGATWHEDHLVPITRYGRLENVYWTYSYSPLDDDSAPSGVGGVIVIVTETTARVITSQHQGFMVRLSDAIHDIDDPDQLVARASAIIGQALGADCVGYADVDGAGTTATVSAEWAGKSGLSVIGNHWLPNYGPAVMAELPAGRNVRVDDIDESPLTPAPIAAAYREIGIGAFILAPMLREDRLRGILFVLSRGPRAWTDAEVNLIAEASGRIGSGLASTRAARALADRERLLRAIGESSGELIFAKDRDHRMLYANGATLAVVGKPLEELIGRTEIEWHADKAQAEEIMTNDRHVIESGESVRVEEAFTGADGRQRVFEGTKAPMRDENGAIVGIVGVTTDVTERNRAQRHLRLMVDELNHRVKNTLAIVQSIAHQTFRADRIAADAKSAFEERLAALSAAHGLLTRESWESVDLDDLAREACGPHMADGRIAIAGPPLRLAPKPAVTIAMTLHELCTNATKYGALSVVGGAVSLRWAIVAGEDAEPRLKLSWRETGGPPVVAPTRRGFGSRMIERALAAELRGTVQLDFAPAGLICTLDAPLEALRGA